MVFTRPVLCEHLPWGLLLVEALGLGVWLGSVGLVLISLLPSPVPQCHRIHRSLASQFKYALVWVSLWEGGGPGSCPA